MAEEDQPGLLPARSEEAVEELGRMVERLRLRFPQARLVGLGVAAAGLIDRESGQLRSFPHREGWRDVSVASELKRLCGLPVVMVNDVHAAAQGELCYGAGRGLRDFVYLHVGRGIAAGIVLNGSLYGGSRGHAGELGHTVMEAGGPVCYCGNYGCLEALASPPALVEAVRQGLQKGARSAVLEIAGGQGENITAAMIFEAAERQDHLAANVVLKAAEHIGRGAANLVNLLNPQALLLGGMLVQGYEFLRGAIERSYQSGVLPGTGRKTEIRCATLGPPGACLGVAALVFADLFADGGRLFALAERFGAVDPSLELSAQPAAGGGKKL